MVRSERKQREFERREEEIIQAAIELFKRNDIPGVTIEQIAEAADIGKGTVYKHFQSKDEIYARIVMQLNRAMRRDIASIDTTLPFRLRLAQIIDVIWQHDMRDAQFLRRLNYQLMSGNFQQHLGSEMQQAMHELQEEDNAFYMQLLGEAQQRGEIIAGPLEPLLFCTTAAIDGAILFVWQMEAKGGVSEAEKAVLLEQLKDFVYRALKSE